MDAVASFFSRTYPGPTTPVQRDDIQKSVLGLITSFPNLLAEMGSPSRDERYEVGGGSFRCGPILDSVMMCFGARTAYALHYNITGQIVPPSGGAVVMWYNTVDLFGGALPDEFLNCLGPDHTLTQGRKTVSNQFNYAWVKPTDASIYGYWASFRKSFAFAMFVSPSTRHLRRYRRSLFRPGFLKGYSVRALEPGTVFDWFETEGGAAGRFEGQYYASADEQS